MLILVADHGELKRFVNPRSDERFAGIVELLVEEGADSPADLQARLRRWYPDAVVRERDLALEAPSWYVYRDGHWVSD